MLLQIQLDSAACEGPYAEVLPAAAVKSLQKKSDPCDLQTQGPPGSPFPFPMQEK